MGITVFFDEKLSEAQIKKLGDQIASDQQGVIQSMSYISSEEAWESFKTDYFGDNENLAEGFSEDNPLAGSASYEIFLRDITKQDAMVSYLNGLPGIRKVNYSSSAAAGLSSFNKILAMLFGAIIIMLLAVAVFLISNTISVAAEFRKNENRIMRFIGATNFMIRAPFVVEGVLIGLIGAGIPLAAMYFLYLNTVNYVTEKFHLLSGIIRFLPIREIYPDMAAISLALGGGLGFIVSFMTIRKHLKA